MARILIPRGPCCSAKKVESTDFEKYFCPVITDHVVCGYTLSVGGGTRAIDVAAGNARVLGLHTENTAACTNAIACLAVCDVHHIYIQVNRDCMCRPNDFTFASNTTGTTPTDAFKIGTATTDCTGTTASVTTIGVAPEMTVANGATFPSEFALNRVFWRTDFRRFYYNRNTEIAPEWEGADTPVGSIQMYAADMCCIPAGWLLADGASVSQSTYAALFCRIAFTYGGSGCCNFALPNFVTTNKFPRAATSDCTLGCTGGLSTVTLSTAQLPSHTHFYRRSPCDPGGTANDTYTEATGSGAIQNSSATGSCSSHENKPPYIEVHYIISV